MSAVEKPGPKDQRRDFLFGQQIGLLRRDKAEPQRFRKNSRSIESLAIICDGDIDMVSML